MKFIEPEFITYKKFNDVVLANELAELLDANDVKYFLEEEAPSFDPSFSYAHTKEYTVKVMPGDFEQVNELVKENAEENIREVESDYYLLSFTNQELMDVITKADEWNAFDVQLARKLLAERGNAISDDEIEVIEEKRIEELKVNEPSQAGWIVVGYVFAVVGGILGFFIGWHLWTYKKTLPNGEMIYAYSESNKRQGKIIFYLSFVGLAVAFVYKLLPLFTGDN
ncbi:hypothetical protein [Mucilaginibacter sp.]|uniref:hypothetical protein n=1 Tax=Mucilaginibacter sp. TaxID=1882438 RepID=UPI00374D5CEE